MWFAVLGLLAIVGAQGTEYFENYYNEIDADDEQADVKTRNAMRSPLQLWPTTRIYYRLASDYSPEEAANVRTALATFDEQTCLHFEELSGPAPVGSRYVHFKKSPKMCGTRVGYNPIALGLGSSSHDVHLTEKCLSKTGIIQHETLHVLGLYHEQSRPDRDEHVVIEYDNIPRKYWPQFIAMTESTTTTHNVPYDFGSVMHYPKNAFAKDPSQPTIRALADGVPVDREMGQVVGPSAGDLFKIRKMYKCDP
ncbi:low choriolytic enzyme [Drosophila grimshawi]|uniref:Metalloendopeptidase n=1 Tax=Drosophila grimshawi TaxID=7222 RepID=B4JGZ2_DROGR|nr:low choriolytic enzyme [Drosophila grimshawi]EDV93770.1 GH19512 [Drosophila grimshawi]